MYDIYTGIVRSQHTKELELTIVGSHKGKVITKIILKKDHTFTLSTKEHHALWGTFWNNVKKVGEGAETRLHTGEKTEMGNYWLAITTNKEVGGQSVPYNGAYLVEESNGKIYDFHHNNLEEDL